jgi:hypothetical protein
MSGPGGPAKPSAIMTPPSGVVGARAIQQIKANVGMMIDKGASETEIDDYLSHEGVTADQLKTSPVAGPGQINGNTPVASSYNPTANQRAKDLMMQRRTGAAAPALPQDASVWTRAMDWVNSLQAPTDTAARAFTGGLSDEAAGAGAATGAVLLGQNPGDAFKKTSSSINANIARFKDANPILSNTLEGLSMAASPLFRAGADWQAAAPTTLGRAVRAGALGAGAGALTGAAYNEGDIGDRLEAAGWGAALGAPLAGIAAPVIETATKAGQSFTDVLNARRAAANDPAERARQMVAQAIARDRMTPTPQQGEALVSAGGPNIQALGRQTTVAPGNARVNAADYFSGASADMPEVIGQAARQNVSSKGFLPSIDEFTKQQQTVSSPLYTSAYKANQSMASPELDKILATPEGKKALRKAAIMMQNDRTRIGIPDKELTETVRDLVAAGKMKAPSTGAGVASGLKLQGLDYVKRALDSEYEGLISAGKKTEAGIILGLKKDLVKELDRLDVTAQAGPNSLKPDGGDYAKARAAFSSPAQMKKAADWGSTVLTSGGFTDEKLRYFSNLSPAEQDAARIGLARNIVEKAGKMGPNTDPVALFLKGKNANDLMRTMLPDQESFDSFVRTLQQQSRIVKANRSVMGGSQTTPRLAENADAAQQEQQLTDQLTMARDAWNLATGQGGGRIPAAQRLLARGSNAVSGVSEPVADELGRMLFNPDAAANLATVRNASGQVPQIQARTAQQQALQRYLATYGTLPPVPVGAFIGSH